MNNAVAAATRILNNSLNPSPVYYVHPISTGLSIVVRRAYTGAPVVWFEWYPTGPNSTHTFESFTRGYFPVQPHSFAPLSHRIVLDDCWGQEYQEPSSH
jgi:hypothetical protein